MHFAFVDNYLATENYLYQDLNKIIYIKIIYYDTTYHTTLLKNIHNNMQLS